MFYAGAGLAQHVLDEFEELAFQTVGHQILVLTSLGSTETAPFALVRTWSSDQANNVGLPAPGLELKLAPVEGKLEARVRGPSIMPGYWRQRDLTMRAFDDEGYYRLGDALTFADPDDPGKGLLFDGRIAEDFKLATGTWVNVGTLRAKFTDHCAPYVRDIVVTGTNQDEIGVLVLPDADACLELCPDLPAEASIIQLAADPRGARVTFSLCSTASRGGVPAALIELPVQCFSKIPFRSRPERSRTKVPSTNARSCRIDRTWLTNSIAIRPRSE